MTYVITLCFNSLLGLVWSSAELTECTCFACQLCENLQFALSAICACRMLLLPHIPQFYWWWQVFWVVSISTDSVSVMVPGGYCSQGCHHHGYLHAFLEAHISAPPFLSLSQAHKLAMSLKCIPEKWQTIFKMIRSVRNAQV